MGVWIETVCLFRINVTEFVTPCMGVWIETSVMNGSKSLTASHPVWVCGLKHRLEVRILPVQRSHPVWVCGLKLFHGELLDVSRSHTLYGCVD